MSIIYWPLKCEGTLTVTRDFFLSTGLGTCNSFSKVEGMENLLNSGIGSESFSFSDDGHCIVVLDFETAFFSMLHTLFPGKVCIGGIVRPLAQIATRVVICPFCAEQVEYTVFVPTGANTRPDLGQRGKPLSSQFQILSGSSKRL